jgi:SAM-dependent methyltransferase
MLTEMKRAAAGMPDLAAPVDFGDAEDDGVEARKAAVRRLFGAEYRPFGRRIEPVAGEVLGACAPEPGAELLDAGAGDGNLAIEAARRGAAVTACDLSGDQVRRGRLRSGEAGVDARWVVADVEQLPFADGSFDVVASALGTVYAPRPRECLGEMFRVLRPGGRLVIATWTSAGLMAEILDLAGAHAPAVGSYRPPPRGIEAPSRWGRYETLYRHLTGLARSFDCEPRRLRLSFASEAELAGFFLDPPGPLAPAMARAGDGERNRLRERVLELTAGAATVELDFLLTVASR